MIKKLVLLIFVVMIGCFSLWLYWKGMSAAEKWLFFNQKVASQYSMKLLAATTSLQTPDELIDVHISAKDGNVTFDPHDQDRHFILSYSPNGEPKPILISGRTMPWKKLKDNWYELDKR